MKTEETITPPERIEGPTPAGGAYALVYRLGDRVEIVEFNAQGIAIARTYMKES